MYLFIFSIPGLSAILILATYELVFFFPRWIYFCLVAAIAGLLILGWQLLRRKTKQLKDYGYFLITPLLLVCGGFLFLIFLETVYIQQLLILAVSFMLFLFLKNIFNYYYKSEAYQAYALENIASYLNLSAAFLLFAGFFALIIFLNFNKLILIALAMLVSLSLVYQTAQINKIPFLKSRVLIVAIGLILTELFWTLTFLPTDFLVNALIMSTAFYVLTGLGRLYLQGSLKRNMLVRYLIISAVVILFSLATAQWI